MDEPLGGRRLPPPRTKGYQKFIPSLLWASICLPSHPQIPPTKCTNSFPSLQPFLPALPKMTSPPPSPPRGRLVVGGSPFPFLFCLFLPLPTLLWVLTSPHKVIHCPPSANQFCHKQSPILLEDWPIHFQPSFALFPVKMPSKINLCQANANGGGGGNDDDSGYAMDGPSSLMASSPETTEYFAKGQRRAKLVEMEENSGGDRIYCHQCKCPIACGNGQFAVTLNWSTTEQIHQKPSPKTNCHPPFWHPSCFVCVECKHPLVDFVFFAHNQNVFCSHHFAELFILSRPKCAECDQLIISGEECTQAEGRLWHFGHFRCANCRIPLGGRQYLTMQSENAVAQSKGHSAIQPAFCLPCFRLNLCQTCSHPISPVQPHIAQANFRWHASAHCFCCSLCQRPLLGASYSLQKGGLLFCSSPSNCAIPPSPCPSSSPSPHSSHQWPSSPKSQLAVHFIGQKKANLPMPPPLPPPIPVKFHSNFANLQNSMVESTENIYETVIPAASSGIPSEIATTTTSSTSSGCSANGSLCSSTAEKYSIKNPSKAIKMPNSPISANNLMTMSSSSTDEEEEEDGNWPNKMGQRMKRPKTIGRRRWQSAEGKGRGRRLKRLERRSPSPPAEIVINSPIGKNIQRRGTFDGCVGRVQNCPHFATLSEQIMLESIPRSAAGYGLFLSIKPAILYAIKGNTDRLRPSLHNSPQLIDKSGHKINPKAKLEEESSSSSESEECQNSSTLFLHHYFTALAAQEAKAQNGRQRRKNRMRKQKTKESSCRIS